MCKHKKRYEEIYCRYKKYTIDEVRKLWEWSKSEYEKTGKYPVIFIDGDKKSRRVWERKRPVITDMIISFYTAQIACHAV